VQGLATSTADCWLEIRMLPEDPNMSQIDQGFPVVFLGSKQRLRWFPNAHCYVRSHAAIATQNFKISAQT